MARTVVHQREREKHAFSLKCCKCVLHRVNLKGRKCWLQLQALRGEVEKRMKANILEGQTVSQEVSGDGGVVKECCRGFGRACSSI